MKKTEILSKLGQIGILINTDRTEEKVINELEELRIHILNMARNEFQIGTDKNDNYHLGKSTGLETANYALSLTINKIKNIIDGTQL